MSKIIEIFFRTAGGAYRNVDELIAYALNKNMFIAIDKDGILLFADGIVPDIRRVRDGEENSFSYIYVGDLRANRDWECGPMFDDENFSLDFRRWAENEISLQIYSQKEFHLLKEKLSEILFMLETFHL